jgi:hypothetical protein
VEFHFLAVIAGPTLPGLHVSRRPLRLFFRSQFKILVARTFMDETTVYFSSIGSVFSKHYGCDVLLLLLFLCLLFVVCCSCCSCGLLFVVYSCSSVYFLFFLFFVFFLFLWFFLFFLLFLLLSSDTAELIYTTTLPPRTPGCFWWSWAMMRVIHCCFDTERSGPVSTGYRSIGVK